MVSVEFEYPVNTAPTSCYTTGFKCSPRWWVKMAWNTQ